MTRIKDCLNEIGLAVARPLYSRAQVAHRILDDTLGAIEVTAMSALWGEEPREGLVAALDRILKLTQNGRSIEELIDASSLGTPAASAARASIDPALVEQVIARAADLARALPERCPCCKQDFVSPDHDPFCSSCVESGWSTAYQRGWNDHQTYGAP